MWFLLTHLAPPSGLRKPWEEWVNFQDMVGLRTYFDQWWRMIFGNIVYSTSDFEALLI